jgi:transposase-like protein
LHGGKALTTAVREYAGDGALIQQCQVHKPRNVLDHLAEEQKSAVAAKLHADHVKEEYEAAEQALKRLHRELLDFYPSEARSLEEDLEETLSVHRRLVPPALRRTQARTNVM